MLKISVVIPYYNSSDTVQQTLDSLVNQSISKQDYEVILVDDGSTDTPINLFNLYNDLINFSYYQIQNSGPGVARNYGVQKSKSDKIAFIDADATAHHNRLQNIIVTLNSGADACGGKIDNYNNTLISQINHLLEFGDYFSNQEYQIRTIPSVNLAFQKDVFNDLGGFDKSLRIGEDTDINRRLYKANYKLIYNPQIIVYHKTLGNFIKVKNKQISTGKKFFIPRKLHPDMPYQLTHNKLLFLLLFLFYWFGNSMLYFKKPYFWKYPIKFTLCVPLILLFRLYFWIGVFSFVIKNNNAQK